ncbi:10202_t:CDS:2, partial [Gigaspora rosea]
QNLRRYLRKDFATNLKVSSMGVALHSPCISHCLQHAFDNCHLDHPEICKNCSNLFTFFDNLKANMDDEFHESLIEPLPGIGPWKEFTPANIQKIIKKRVIKKPEPTITTHSQPSKSWTMPVPEIQ